MPARVQSGHAALAVRPTPDAPAGPRGVVAGLREIETTDARRVAAGERGSRIVPRPPPPPQGGAPEARVEK